MNVDVSIEQGIARVLLDCPPLNLLSNMVKQDITHVFRSLSENKDTRVILFETAGDHFCCGANLKEFPDRIDSDRAKQAWIEGHDMFQAIMETPQPTVVCVKGNALGAGAELASAFDIRLFASDVTCGYPEVSRSVFPGNGGFERFIQLAGEANAAYLFLTGTKITAVEALRIGLANKVVEKDDLELEGMKIAELMAGYSYVTISTIKDAIKSYRQKDKFFKIGMDAFDCLHKTKDIHESINAFFEKREPNYRHK